VSSMSEGKGKRGKKGKVSFPSLFAVHRVDVPRAGGGEKRGGSKLSLFGFQGKEKGRGEGKVKGGSFTLKPFPPGRFGKGERGKKKGREGEGGVPCR